jgi:hypothetical protein
MNIHLARCRHLTTIGLLVLCVLLILTTLAGAAPLAAAPLLADAVVVKSTPTTNYGALVELGVSASTPTGGVCGGAAESYLRFNLNGLAPITSAKLTVQALGLSIPAGGAMTMRLWGASAVDANGWAESVITWNTKPTLDRDLNTTANVASSGSIVFNSSSEFVQYLNDRRGTPDATATIAIIMNTCTGTAIEQRLGSGNNATIALRPILDINNPTAVTMSTFRSADPAVNWPLIAGLGALAAAVIGGLAVNRKRAAGR